MIGMLMRDDHRRQRRRLDAESQQARFGFAQLETAIDEVPCAAVFDQRGVAFGAGAEHRETDHGRRSEEPTSELQSLMRSSYAVSRWTKNRHCTRLNTQA